MIEVFVVKQWPALRREIRVLQKGVIFSLDSKLDLVCQEIQQPGRKKGTALPWCCCTCFHQHGKCSKISKERQTAEASWHSHLLQQWITCFPGSFPTGHCHCLSCHPSPSLHLGTSSSFSREVCPSPSSLTNTLALSQRFRDRKVKERERSTEWREGSAARVMSAQFLLLYYRF